MIRHLVAAQEIHLNDSNNLDTSTSLNLGLPNCELALLSKDEDSERKKDIDFFDESDDGGNSIMMLISSEERFNNHFLCKLVR